jgi:predicted transcriptional regulator
MSSFRWTEKRKEVLLKMTKPKTPSEIRQELGTENTHVNVTLKQFIQHGIARILNEKEKIGRLYGLTEEGQKKLRDFCTEKKIEYVYCEPAINWQKYSLIVRGRNRKKVIKVMDEPKTFREIRKETGLPAKRVCDVLMWFCEKGIAKSTEKEELTGRGWKKKVRVKRYELVGDFNEIREQLLKK